MARSISFSQALERLYKVFGESYTYNESSYTDAAGTLEYTCSKHGVKVSRVGDMFKGHGCPECGKEKSKATHRSRAARHLDKLKEVHPTYQFPNYIENFTLVTDKCEVVCPTHGTFFAPTHHLKNGKGCRKCGHERTAAAKRWTRENLVTRLQDLLPNSPYTYHPDTFTGYYDKMKITCAVHGEFWQTPEAHVQGKGCGVCARLSNSAKASVSSDELLRRCIEVHGDTYTYPEKLSGVATLWQIGCKRHGEFEQLGYVHLRGSRCPICSGIGSNGQRKLLELVRQYYPSAISDYRFSRPSRHQIDVYIPELKMGFEYHGLYWHSSANKHDTYHMEKQELAKAEGITLYQMFADEFDSEVGKKFVIRKLEKSKAIYARKCQVVDVPPDKAKDFYRANHIQGYNNYGISKGLNYQGNLVAVMTFTRFSSIRGIAPEPGSFELRRFATSCRVTGAGSKLLQALIKDTGAKSITSYSDNRLFSGKMYEALGFKKVHVTKPSYTYCAPNNRVRLHKSNFRHSKLPKILGDMYNPSLSERANCENAGYFQIYDCGLSKWVLNLE